MPWPAVIHCELPETRRPRLPTLSPVLHRAFGHVRHGLEPAMRMIGEPRDVVQSSRPGYDKLMTKASRISTPARHSLARSTTATPPPRTTTSSVAPRKNPR